MFAVLNVETGDFYSESPILKREMKHTGMHWNNASILPCFARPYSRYRDALKRSQRLTPFFFVASVVAPPESPDLGTTPQKVGGTLGH